MVTIDEQGDSILITPESISTIRLVEEAQKVNAESSSSLVWRPF
jgi:hypothetical protein